MVLAFPINFFESTVASLCYCHAGISCLARHVTANCGLLKHKMCDLSCRRSISLRTQNMSSSKSRAQREALGKCAWFQTFWLCTSLMGVRASWHWLLNFFEFPQARAVLRSITACPALTRLSGNMLLYASYAYDAWLKASKVTWLRSVTWSIDPSGYPTRAAYILYIPLCFEPCSSHS